jgi:flagellar assembly factor FliW
MSPPATGSATRPGATWEHAGPPTGGRGASPMTSSTETERPEATLSFPFGIPGLRNAGTDFVLEALGEEDEGAFQLLRSVADPEIALIVTVPWLFFPDYAPDLPDSELDELGIVQPEEAIVFCPVTLHAEEETIYLNLLGPFVVNGSSRVGRQIVLTDGEHPVRAAVRLDLA